MHRLIKKLWDIKYRSQKRNPSLHSLKTWEKNCNCPGKRRFPVTFREKIIYFIFLVCPSDHHFRISKTHCDDHWGKNPQPIHVWMISNNVNTGISTFEYYGYKGRNLLNMVDNKFSNLTIKNHILAALLTFMQWTICGGISMLN